MLAQLTTKLDLLTTKHELLQLEVLPWLQSEHGVRCSSVFGQLPAGVTTTIHGALPCLMHSAELQISESSHVSSSSQSGKNVGIMNEGVHERCACLSLASWQRTTSRLFCAPMLAPGPSCCPRLLSHSFAAPFMLQYIDRKHKQCKEAARRLYGVEEQYPKQQYCQVTGRIWQRPDILSCSHIISRGWYVGMSCAVDTVLRA